MVDIQSIASFLVGGILLLIWVIFLVIMKKFFDKQKKLKGEKDGTKSSA